MGRPSYAVAVIPLLHLFDIHIKRMTQLLNLIVSKSKDISHSAWIYHGILPKIVQCRLGIVLLNRQDASEICPGKDTVGVLGLEQAAEQHDILVKDCRSYTGSVALHLAPFGKLAANGIPLVNYEEELFAFFIVNGREDTHQVCCF